MAKTIAQLEDDYWPEPAHSYNLALTIHRLRKKPIDQFGVEELRFMIGQNIGTQHLMPRALGMLEQSPLVEEYHYPGEVLHSILKLPNKYWSSHPDHLRRACTIAQLALDKLAENCERNKKYALRTRGGTLNDHQCLDQIERQLQALAISFLVFH